MKSISSTDKGLLRRARGGGLLLVLIAALMLEATTLIQNHFAKKGMTEEAQLRAEAQMEATRLKILNVIDQTEAAVRSNAWAATWGLNHLDTLPALTRLLVQDNPVIIGSAIALVPGYNKKRELFAPYSYQKENDDSVYVKSLATDEYRYQEKEWFTKPLELGKGYWSEPYLDEGGGEIMMTTYSLPVYDKQGKVAAILTADISLDWLTQLVGNVEVYPSAFSIMLSREGKFMVCPTETLVMRQTVQEAIANLPDTSAVSTLTQDMLSGKTGVHVLRYNKLKEYVYFAPIERTGWAMSIVIPSTEIFDEVQKQNLWVQLFQLLGLLMLALIIRSFIKNQSKFRKLTESKGRMERELQIARGIQMAMLPKIFPPFPERKDIDMFGTIIPAKEVGGDLYDFFIRQEKLYFCIGDVSGKGVPASLLMAVTRSLFRTVSAHEKSPQRIVTAINQSMSEMNENNMFVTFFCGVLDLNTGHLRYCNAGHNAPRWQHAGTFQPLPVVPNLSIGVLPGMSFKEQEVDLSYGDTLFLYTDGLTEATNVYNELFGESRMDQAFLPDSTAQEQLSHMRAAVKDFVGSADQSDDLTMLCFRYMNEISPDTQERHLILHNDIQQIPQLAGFVEAIAEEKHLSQSLAMGLNLALEEAVTNVIMYAYPPGADGLVDIEAIIRKESLDFIITDSGIPFDPTAAPTADITLGVEERPIGGLGIYLVRSIMDTVRYERTDGKNILSMTKQI